MSQRYFLTTESTYEALRLAVDADLGYPTATASSIFTPALQAPRDSLRRIVLAVDTSLPGYGAINSRVSPLLANSSVQELTEAEYKAFLTCVPSPLDGPAPHGSTHGVAGEDAVALDAAQVSTATTYTNFLPEGGSLATALSGIDTAIGDRALASDFDQGVKTTDDPTFTGVHFNQYPVDWTIEPRGSLGGAFDFKATLSGVTTTVFSVANNGTVENCSIPWSLLTSVPSTFAPSAHKTSHATGGSDALSPSDIGAATALHAHSVGDISFAATDRLLGRSSSGAGVGEEITCTAAGRALLDDADAAAQRSTLGLGTAATSNTGDFATAGHTHAQLHDRSHAITSASDHTATAWRAFYSNGSGVITELALGAANTVLTSNGASAAPTFSALPAGGTKSFAKFTASDNNPPASNFATLDQRNSVLVLEFDAATDESAVFVGYIPEGATLTNGLKVRLSWMADTATSGNVRWGVQFEADGTDLDADSYDTATLVTSAANGTSGIETVAEITATAIDSLAAGDRFRLRVYRDADDATNDTMTGDAQLVAVEVQVA